MVENVINKTNTFKTSNFLHVLKMSRFLKKILKRNLIKKERWKLGYII